MKEKVWQIMMLLTAFMLMAVVAINRDHRLFGIDLKPAQPEEENTILTVAEDGSTLINTTDLCKNITGYAGTTPLQITVKDGIITDITPLENAETPGFFKRAEEGVLSQYIGKSTAEAAELKADAVSGATFSSDALINNVRQGTAYAEAKSVNTVSRSKFSFSWEWLCVLIVTLCGAILPLFVKSKVYRTIQLILNAGVLGFWSGTFLSYALMVGYLSNGLDVAAALAPLVMLVAAFIYPVFGRPNHYCTWICPLGSMQDLASMLTPRKLHLSPNAVKWLTLFRQLLWCGLMTILWIGVGFAWMDYELFTAFIVKSASWVVISIAAAFVLLSLLVPRPFCRFVCPTGSLFKISTAKPQEK